jgi:hypothetical protein
MAVVVGHDHRRAGRWQPVAMPHIKAEHDQDQRTDDQQEE